MRIAILIGWFWVTTLVGLAQADGLLPASENGKWGYLNRSGDWVVQPQFDRCHPFDGEPYSWAVLNGRSYLIDTNGTINHDVSFSNLISIHYPVMIYREGYNWGWYNRDLNQQIPAQYGLVKYLIRNKRLLIKDSLFGVADVDGTVLVDPIYQEIEDKNQYFLLHSGKLVGVANPDGKLVVPVEYELIRRYSDFYVAVNNKVQSLYNTEGKLLYSGKFENVRYLLDDYFSIELKKRALLINARANDVCDSNASMHGVLDGQNIVLRRDSLMGLFSLEYYREILPISYRAIGMLTNSALLRVQQKGNQGLYDRAGNEVIPIEYEMILPPEQWGAVKVRKSGFWGLMDTLGNELLPCEFINLAVGNDRVIKARGFDGILMVEFDERNQIVDSLRFMNTASISLQGRLYIGDMAMGNFLPNGQINPALLARRNPSNLWFQDTSGKWGMMDTTGAVFVRPIFDDIQKVVGTEYVLCRISQPHLFTIGENLRIHADSRYALVDEIRFRKMTPPTLLFIDTANVSDTSINVFRIMDANGFFSTVNKTSGRIIRYASRYLAPFREGRAAIFMSQRITSGTSLRNEEFVLANPDGFTAEFNLRYTLRTWSSNIEIYGTGYWGYIDEDGLYVLPPATFKGLNLMVAKNFKHGRAIVANHDSIFAILDPDGNNVLNFEYNLITRLKGTGDSLFLVQKISEMHGYTRTDGYSLTPVMFNQASDYHHGFAWAEYDNLKVLLNRQGDQKELPGLYRTGTFSEGIAGVAEGYRYALYDTSLNQITDYLYSRVGESSNGLIPIRRKGRYGYIDTTGNYLIKPNYIRAESFSNGLAVVKPYRERKKSLYGYINEQGEYIHMPKFNRAQNMNEQGYAEVRRNGRRGIVGKEGKALVPTRFRRVYDGNNRFVGDTYGRIVVYNRAGKKIKAMRGRVYGGYQDNKLVVNRNKRFGVIDTSGNVILPFKHRKIMPFENGVSAFQSGRNAYIINDMGDTIHRFDGRIRTGFSSGLILVRRGGEYEYLTVAGQNKFGLTFERAEPFENGLAIVRYKGNYGLLDQDGYFRIEPLYSKISPPQDDVCIVTQRMHLGVCTLNSTFVIPPIADDIQLDTKNNVFRFTSRNRYGYFTRDGKLIREAL